ncbi:hypothetical protein FOMG_19559 [Fusarium oxysporum f. sp. melonis 26406]|uniref:Uncharacterized protein n=1 Tax=Fusarium oxysporum f. sp. melonis 26406 TaxID=1089452 RepID=W9YWY6_FUSOX|nr:hypothetical protein FOMG_19559 [Fusarium oxysporum f. sp. melonis 26406]
MIRRGILRRAITKNPTVIMCSTAVFVIQEMTLRTKIFQPVHSTSRQLCMGMKIMN